MRALNKLVVFAVALLAVAAMGYGAYRVVREDGGAQAEADSGDDGVPAATGVHAMTYTDESGNAQALSAFKGRWLVIDLTGTTCIYCPAQYDELRELRASVPASSVAVLSVEVWGADVDEMSATADDEGLAWDWGVDRGGAFAQKWGTTVPRIVVVDPMGNVVREFSAGIASSEDIRAEILL